MNSQKDTNELVSVVIPTYNRMGTLERSIHSVLAQTYDNFELLIIDDGSTDGTEAYVRGLADARISYYRNESNVGPSASRNKGAALAKGAYLAFQDSDDEWAVDKLEKTMRVLVESDEDTGMVYHEMQEQGGNGDLIPSRNIPISRKEGKIFDYMLLYPLIGIPAAVIKKTCFESVGGFSEDLKSFEDYEFFLRMAKRYEIAFVQEPLIRIYDTAESVNKQYKNKIDAELYILQNEYKSLQLYGILKDKIGLIRLQADNYGCEDYFYEKIFELCRESFSEKQAEEVLACVHKVATTFVGIETGDRSAYYQHATEQMEHLVTSLSRLQANIRVNAQMLLQNRAAICEALLDVLGDLKNYSDLALHPQKEKMELIDLEDRLKVGANTVPVISNVLDSVLAKGRALLGQMSAAKCTCTACGNQVRFLPTSSYQRKVREYWGCNDVGKVYLFEDTEKDRCPICGATQQIRFLLGFLEDVQGEAGEKLCVACMHTSDEMYRELFGFVQKYTMFRDDMEYVPNGLEAQDAPKRDVLIAVNILDGTKDLERLQQLRDTLTDQGVGILMVPAIAVDDVSEESREVAQTFIGPGENYIQSCYSEDELHGLAQQVGMELQTVDQTWFGEEYYLQYGFGEEAKLFMLTIRHNS